ncbi:MAG: peptidase [Lysobacteraceae bacterium]|nr:MAG: peptidase [Xanthomonadaceae bacterium]
MSRTYPIGTPGQPWGEAERARWRALQVRRRSHADEVLAAIERLAGRFEVETYGWLEYPPDRYPLVLVRSRSWDARRPVALVTGGVHGYETSGVHGALRFLDRHAAEFEDRANLLVVPCVSPWGYERIHRWNAEAVDPNRSFRADSPALEAALLMQRLAPLAGRVRVHIDLHETTDSDETEFRPALAARDGKPFQPGTIPDGFYLVGDVEQPRLDFQQAILREVASVTHIAPPDAHGRIIGADVVAPGLILYPYRELGLCAGMTDAPFRTTTEVYPDSPLATPEQCNEAQAVAVCAALRYALDATV